MMNSKRRDAWIAVLRRHNAGEKHTEIAKDLGISRERVRQIVEKAGGEPRRQQAKEVRLRIVTHMADMDVGFYDAMSAVGVTETTMRAWVRETGTSLRKPKDDRRKKLKKAAGAVLAGASYGEAAKRFGFSKTHVAKYCSYAGVKSRHKSRNPSCAEVAS